MDTPNLAGKKIAVIVESEYIPEEIQAYQKLFGAMGAQLDLIAPLRGEKKLTFVSDVDHFGASLDDARQKLEALEVSIDLEQVKPEDYAAVLMSANYTSVRLRWFDVADGAAVTPDKTRYAPSVQFFARAMRYPRIVKGALCHALWILTPAPELLAGRRVICHRVVLADIANAGATYIPPLAGGTQAAKWQPYPGVVVDGDLVTGESAQVVESYVRAIAQQIAEIERRPARNSANAVPTLGQLPENRGRRSILTVLSEYGYWGEELLGPLETFEQAGYHVDFLTSKGTRPRALPPSMDPEYVDPPLGRPVTSEEVAAKVRAMDDVSSSNRTARSLSLDRTMSLDDLGVPERPYWSHPAFVRAMEAYNRDLAQLAKRVARYDALLIIGGSGPIVDLANNQRIHDLILSFCRADKLIAAECYGVTCLAFARDMSDRKSIIWGKRVTGHCLEYDYKDGTGFLGTDFNMGPPPYPLEFILRDATGPDGAYIGNFGKDTSVIVDYPFITGRSTPDSYLTGQKVVEVLESGSPPRLRRFGW